MTPTPTPIATSAAEIEAWVRLAVDGAEEKLGHRTEAFLVGEILGITDWFVVTSAQTTRQVKAIVEGVEEMVFLGDGPRPLRIEGLDAPDWVLMDYGSFLVHVFTDEAREYFELERLWSDVPRLKFTRADGSVAGETEAFDSVSPEAE